MPCSDSSSSISLIISQDDHFIGFDFAKITCGREITAKTGYATYCVGKTLQDILAIPYAQVVQDLNITAEEEQFILYLEWDALRATIVKYLGIDDEDIDSERCIITSIDYQDDQIEVALVILPPNELPKILPCRLNEDIDAESSG